MRTLQNLSTLVLFALGLVGVFMVLAYLPIDTGFLPTWADDVLGVFPPLDSAAGTLVVVGVIGGIVLTSILMMVAPSVKNRGVRS